MSPEILSTNRERQSSGSTLRKIIIGGLLLAGGVMAGNYFGLFNKLSAQEGALGKLGQSLNKAGGGLNEMSRRGLVAIGALSPRAAVAGEARGPGATTPEQLKKVGEANYKSGESVVKGAAQPPASAKGAVDAKINAQAKAGVDKASAAKAGGENAAKTKEQIEKKNKSAS